MTSFTKVNLPSLDDAAAGSGVEGQSFRGARDALDCTRSGLSYQQLDPGTRQPFGHAHREEEEIYVVLAGSGTLKVDDDEVEVGELDAVRVSPSATRAFEAGPQGLAFLAMGSPGGGQADGDIKPGWWGEEG